MLSKGFGMRRILVQLQSTFTGELVSFVAGLLAATVIGAILDQVIRIDLGLTLIVFVLFVVFATATLVRMRNDVTDRLRQFALNVHTYYASRSNAGDKTLYDPIIPKITSAKESLFVVGLHRPQTMQSSQARVKYYKAIEDLLEKHQKQGSRFKYERIIQVKSVGHRSLDSSQLDIVTLKHCKHILGLQGRRSLLSLQMRQMPDVLGSMSFVIIDEKELLLAIPTVNRDNSSNLKASDLGAVVSFTDNEGSLVREMLQLFDELRLSAEPIGLIAEGNSQ